MLHRYLVSSSSVIPMPLSSTLSVPASASRVTVILYCSSADSLTPRDSRRRSLVTASVALDTISLRNISFSEYSHFFIMGNICSVSTDIPPFLRISSIFIVFSVFVYFLLIILGQLQKVILTLQLFRNF